MARLNSPITFIGSIGDISAYRVKGSEEIFIRRKGGPSRERVRTAPEFATTRRLNSEFGGRSTFSKYVLRSMFSLKMLADHNVSGPLNKLVKPLQDLDSVSEYGKRNILLSTHPKLLEGFSFNRIHPVEQVLSAPIKLKLLRETFSADINIPHLMTGINFRGVQKYPFCSFVFSLGVIPDLFWTPEGYRPSVDTYEKLSPALASTEWFPSITGSPATNLTIRLEHVPPNEQCIVALGVGIRFGVMLNKDTIEQSSFGCAKILSVV